MTIPINISPATNSDIPALVNLVNLAYRGTSEHSWTAEAHLFEGDARSRTDESALLDQLNTPGSVTLKCTAPDGKIIGCVYLEQQDKKLYLGMLSVWPGLQGGGIGKQLLEAANDYAREKGCLSVTMTVISLRHELIKWYERHGYLRTGKTEPYPQDNRYGIPVQPLEFVVLEKKVS